MPLFVILQCCLYQAPHNDIGMIVLPSVQVGGADVAVTLTFLSLLESFLVALMKSLRP